MWVDNCVVGGYGQDAKVKKNKMKQLFECNNLGELLE